MATLFSLFYLNGLHAQKDQKINREVVTESQKQKMTEVLKASGNKITMLENKGQLPSKVLYSMTTNFGGLYVEKDQITLIALKGVPENANMPSSGTSHYERQTVHITFEGGTKNMTAAGKNQSPTMFNFWTDEGQASNVASYGEVFVENVYPGIDLRLYSQEDGSLEFDWILERAEDFHKIRMHMEGHEGIELNKKGGFKLKSRFEALSFEVPESYQMINGKKIPVNMSYTKVDDNTVTFRLDGEMAMNEPLVIDPTVLWATFFDGYAACDSYLFATTSDECNRVYCAGRTKATINNIYFAGGTGGYDNSFNAGTECCIIYTFSADGKQIEYYTYFGTSLTPADMDRFDNGRIIVVGMRAGKNGGGAPGTIPTAGIVTPAWSNNTNLGGWVAIFSADLATCYYASGLPGATALPADKTGMGVTTVKIINDSTYIVSGISTNITATNYPLANKYGGSTGPFVPPTAVDPTFGGTYEGYLAKFSGNISNASTADDYNQKQWATWIGSSANEFFLSFELDTGQQYLAFTGNFRGAALTPVNGTNRAVGFPTLVDPVDSIATADEGFVGVIENACGCIPTKFNMLSYLGGSLNEQDNLCVIQDPYLYVLCNSQSSDFPGTAVSGVYDQTYNGTGTQWKKGDAVISRVPLTGRKKISDFRSTYFGGKQDDFSGGIIYNHKDNNLYTFISTSSLTSMQSGGADNFPVKNTIPGSNFYDSAKDVAGGGSTSAQNLDMNFATFSSDLTTLIFSTYCGGSQRDYLGQTGCLLGSGHYDFNHETGIYTLGTTVHSYDFNVPGESGPTPGIISPMAFDGTHGSNATGTYGTVGTNGDQHFITMFNLASQDLGDAPISYEGGNWAKHGSNSFSNVFARFGSVPTDYESTPQSSPFANGDDLLNSGNSSCVSGGGSEGDDEDAISQIPPILSVETTGFWDLSIKAVNNTGSLAYIYAWLDFNGDGVFQSNEAATRLPSGSTYAMDTFRSSTNTTPRSKTIRFDLGAGKSCPVQIKSGRTYLRLRITTVPLPADSVATTNIDERSHGPATNGEVEDHMIYIRGRDYGDFNSTYPVASAMIYADPNEDGIPDSLGAVWAGDYVDIEKDCQPNQSPTAQGDDNEGVPDDEDGLTFPAGPFTANTAYTFPLKLSSNVPGTTIYYGVWFDWDADGDFTSPQDDYVSGSSTPGTVNINVTSAPGGNFSPKFGVRVIVGTSAIVSADYNSIRTNGEVEDYQNDPGLLISGTVFDDGDGYNDGLVDGAPKSVINNPSGVPLYAYLINGSGVVVDVVPVNTDGTYTLSGGVAASSYEVQISTTVAAIGATAPSAASLPSNWGSVVEQYGTNNAFGSGLEPQPANTPNSRIPVTFGTTDITNVNFGIDFRPTSDDKTADPQPNPGGAIQYPVPALTGGDLEEGSMGTGKTIVIKVLPPATGPSGGILYYNGTPVTTGQVIVSYNPAALTVDPDFINAGTIVFEYVFRDSAFLEDLSNATVTLPFTDPTILISGHLFHDEDGVVDAIVDGTLFNNPSGVQMYAYLVNESTNVIIDVEPISSGGDYTLQGIISSNYKVLVSSIVASVGSTLSSSTITSGWVNTGESFGYFNTAGIGLEVGTGAADGSVIVHTGTVDITDVDFGIEQPNIAHNKTYVINPDSLIQLTGAPFGGYVRWLRLNHPTGTSNADFNTGSYTDKPGRISGLDPEDAIYNGISNNIGAKMVFLTMPDTSNVMIRYNEIRLVPNPTPLDASWKYWNATASRYEIDSVDADSFIMLFKFNYQLSTEFIYAYYDAAHILGASATYKITYSVPLPVQQIDLRGRLNNSYADLNWTNIAEEDVYRYHLYRQTAGSSDLRLINSQFAENGYLTRRYNYRDKLSEMSNGSYIYFLKAEWQNGKRTAEGSVIIIKQNDLFKTVVLTPNPASDILKIQLYGFENAISSTVMVYDGQGQVIMTKEMKSNTTNLNTTNLPEGIYIVNVNIDGEVFNQKIVVLHR